ncbi:MAG: ankyrin repeat domain-containing protein, partial [Gammaproteobacteria bacterium]|nr:ankyrin repeat domain-containing protein [Gammaproteobacteria bacterium]
MRTIIMSPLFQRHTARRLQQMLPSSRKFSISKDDISDPFVKAKNTSDLLILSAKYNSAKDFIDAINATDVNTKYSNLYVDGDSAAHFAARRGDMYKFSLLISRDPGVITYTNKNRQTPLYDAASAGHIGIIDAIRLMYPENHPLVYQATNTVAYLTGSTTGKVFQMTPLMAAIRYGHTRTATKLMNNFNASVLLNTNDILKFCLITNNSAILRQVLDRLDIEIIQILKEILEKSTGEKLHYDDNNEKLVQKENLIEPNLLTHSKIPTYILQKDKSQPITKCEFFNLEQWIEIIADLYLKFFARIKENLTPDDRKTFLREHIVETYNTRHFNGLKRIKSQIVVEILSQIDHNDDNLFHVAGRHSNTECIRVITEYIRKNIRKSTVKKAPCLLPNFLVSSGNTDRHERTPIHELCLRQDTHSSLHSLLSFGFDDATHSRLGGRIPLDYAQHHANVADRQAEKQSQSLTAEQDYTANLRRLRKHYKENYSVFKRRLEAIRELKKGINQDSQTYSNELDERLFTDKTSDNLGLSLEDFIAEIQSRLKIPDNKILLKRALLAARSGNIDDFRAHANEMLRKSKKDVTVTLGHGIGILHLAARLNLEDLIHAIRQLIVTQTERHREADQICTGEKLDYDRVIDYPAYSLKGGLITKGPTKGVTALFEACYYGSVESVKALLQYNASIKLVKESHLAPIIIAAWGGHGEILLMLIKHAIKARENHELSDEDFYKFINTKNNNNESALYWVTYNLCLLSAEDARLKSYSKLLAAFHLLLDQGADPNITTKRDNRTAMHLAAIAGDNEIGQILINSGGTSLEIQSGVTGMTPLHNAAANGHAGFTKLLIKNKADIFARNFEGKLPITMAEATKIQQMLARAMWLRSAGSYRFFGKTFDYNKSIA